VVPANLVERAFAAFAADLATPPPLPLRGGSDVDSYTTAAPFDAALDQITDEYLEEYAYWGLIYLDARSWRYYVPHIIAYAASHPDDPRMVVEALVRSLRPPDRYPSRLPTLTAAQESIVTAFLEHLLVDAAWDHLRHDVQQALEEWWWPNPRCRPTADAIDALRHAPMTYRTVGEGDCRLDLPHTLTGGGLHDIREESRRVEVWGGPLCGDAHTVVAVNVTPLALKSFAHSMKSLRARFHAPVAEKRIAVRGAREAHLLQGLTDGDSPAEPQAFTVLLASTRTELVTLSIRTWPRDDVSREVERIVQSFRLRPG
jgi:hypothetical protein